MNYYDKIIPLQRQNSSCANFRIFVPRILIETQNEWSATNFDKPCFRNFESKTAANFKYLNRNLNFVCYLFIFCVLKWAVNELVHLFTFIKNLSKYETLFWKKLICSILGKLARNARLVPGQRTVQYGDNLLFLAENYKIPSKIT